MIQKGYFVTLEGPDGCGKSTQAQLLAEYLRSSGYEVVLTREPGGTGLAEEIRRLILTPGEEVLDPMTEILLYTAARVQHVQELIKPALEQGKIVICDRFVDSSFAYQGYGLGWDLQLIQQVTTLAIGNFRPDLTLLLDGEVQECQNRVNNRADLDRIEARGEQFHQRVRQGFLDLAKQESRIVLLKTNQKGIKQIHQEILKILLPKFQFKPK